MRRELGLCVGCGRCVTVCSTSPDAGDALEMRRPPDGAAPSGTEGPPCGVLDHEAVAEPPVSAGTPAAAPAWVASPKRDTLRASGCTFCGQCIIVCPGGALTASPGPEGQMWLEGRRKRYPHLIPVLPPASWTLLDQASLSTAPEAAGVFQVADAEGQVLQISGCADLREGLAEVLAGRALPGVDTGAGAVGPDAAGRGDAVRLFFRFELAPLYTERESELLARFAQEHGHLPPGNDLADDLFDGDSF